MQGEGGSCWGITKGSRPPAIVSTKGYRRRKIFAPRPFQALTHSIGQYNPRVRRPVQAPLEPKWIRTHTHTHTHTFLEARHCGAAEHPTTTRSEPCQQETHHSARCRALPSFWTGVNSIEAIRPTSLHSTASRAKDFCTGTGLTRKSLKRARHSLGALLYNILQ